MRKGLGAALVVLDLVWIVAGVTLKDLVQQDEDSAMRRIESLRCARSHGGPAQQ